MTTLTIRSLGALALLVPAACGSDELFHLDSVAHGLSIRQHASTRVDGGTHLIAEVMVVGDLDGDGYDDAFLRDPGFRLDGDYHQRGAVRVLYGGPGLSAELSLDALPALIDDAAFLSNGGMHSLSPVGDVDGDGLADVLVGDAASFGCSAAEQGDPPGPWSLPEAAMHGGAYLIYGRPTRFIGLTTLGQVGAELRDASPCTSAGATVEGLGDLDHDGFADFAITASDPGSEDHWLGLGQVYVFYGGSTRLPLGPHDLASSADARVNAAPDSYGFATKIAAAGDVDADGFDDLLLGDYPYGGYLDTPLHGIGHAYVIRGRAERLVGTVDVTSLASTTITGDLLPFQMAGLGDLDGDGAADFAVNALGEEHRVDRTAYHVFYGRAGGLPAQLTTAEAEAHLLAGEGNWGMGPLASGDVDADGHRDLIMGDANLGDARGGVYVVRGEAARLAGDVDMGRAGVTYEGATVHIPCPHTSDWDGQESCTAQEFVGAWMGVGDLDGDGRTDVLAAAPSGEGAASAYLVTGAAP